MGEIKFHINTWLERNNFLKLRNKRMRLFFQKNIRRLPIFLRRFLLSIIKRKYRYNFDSILGIDKSNSIAWSEHAFCIMINKNFRFKANQIIRKLKSLKYCNHKVIKLIRHNRRNSSVLFLVNERFVPTIKLYENVFQRFKRCKLRGRHYSDIKGIFIAYGPDIKKDNINVKVRLIDITPTILYLFGIPIPKDMDGRVLREIFEKEFRLSRKLDHKRNVETFEEERIKKVIRSKLQNSIF